MTYHLGQRLPLARQPIVEPGVARWHVLRVLPQKESAAEAWLQRRGVYAFHPVKQKVVRLRGKAVQRQVRYLPGYTFARFPGPARCHCVLDSPFIAGAVCMSDGRWGIVDPDSLRGVHSLKPQSDDANRADRIRPGDRVKVITGIVGVGETVEVVELREGRAKVRLRIFGADDVPTEYPISSLERVGLLE